MNNYCLFLFFNVITIVLYFFTWFVVSLFLYFKICFFLINRIGFLNFSYVAFSISFICISYIIESNIIDCYKYFWISLILTTNIFGCFFYLSFGKRNINYNRRVFRCITRKILTDFNNINYGNFENNNPISEIIFNKTGSKLCDCKIKYFYNSKEVKQIILDKIKMAKRFVFIEFFFIESGSFLSSIIDILSEKVKKENVEIRIIYDGLGSLNRIPFWFDKKLNKLGIKTVVFKKYNLFFYDINCRDHRKIIIIDGEIGFSGSFNISNFSKDSFLMLEGKCVHNLTISFLIQWLDIKNVNLEKINMKDYVNFFPKISNDKENNNSNNLVQVYTDFPYNYYDCTNTTFYVYLNLIISAKKYIYIVTPYFLIDKKIRKELLRALKRGVNLIIIIPKHSDIKISDFASYDILNELLNNGAKIFRNIKTINDNYFMHSKFCIVDDMFAIAGSFNLNFRSFFLDYENSFFIVKNNCIEDMKKHFLLLLNESEKYEIKKNFFVFNFLLNKIKIFC